MTIALRCFAAVFVVPLIEPHLRVIFLGGIEQKRVSVMYQQINIALSNSWENLKMFFYNKLLLYDKMEHI